MRKKLDKLRDICRDNPAALKLISEIEEEFKSIVGINFEDILAIDTNLTTEDCVEILNSLACDDVWSEIYACLDEIIKDKKVKSC